SWRSWCAGPRCPTRRTWPTCAPTSMCWPPRCGSRRTASPSSASTWPGSASGSCPDPRACPGRTTPARGVMAARGSGGGEALGDGGGEGGDDVEGGLALQLEGHDERAAVDHGRDGAAARGAEGLRRHPAARERPLADALLRLAVGARHHFAVHLVALGALHHG